MTEANKETPATSIRDRVPATLAQPGAIGFWLAVVLTGVGTGISAAVLTRLLDLVQHLAWPGDASLLQAATRAGPWRHILVLAGAGVLTGLGQIVLVRLSSGNGIDTTEAIWFWAGRLPPLRTLGSAFLSVLVVGMGASIGREGAPKQAGAVIANALSDRGRFSDERRRLGRGLRRSPGRRALRAGSHARRVGAADGASRFADLTDRRRGFLDGTPRRADLFDSSIRQFGVDYLLGVGRRPDRWRCLRRLRPDDRLGRPCKAQRFAPDRGTHSDADGSRVRFHRVSAAARKRQGHHPACTPRTRRAGVVAGVAVLEARGDRELPRQRRPGRPSDPFSYVRRDARWRTRLRLVLVLAWRPCWALRPRWRGGRLGGHDPGADLRHRRHDGADRPRPIICRAAVVGGRDGDPGVTQFGDSIDLRREVERRTDSRSSKASRPILGGGARYGATRILNARSVDQRDSERGAP